MGRRPLLEDPLRVNNWSSSEATVQQVIKRYGLKPHPEGGYYREIHRSAQEVFSLEIRRVRSACTHIYFLLGQGQVSRFHRLAHDEVWNLYEGASLRLIRYEDGRMTEEYIGLNAGGPATVVKGGVYLAAESTGSYSLAGCTVAPGFEFDDFAFLSADAGRAELERRFPEYVRFL